MIARLILFFYAAALLGQITLAQYQGAFQAPRTGSGLVAAWETTEGTGTSVHDYSASAQNLTITGATWYGTYGPLTSSLVYASSSTYATAAGNTNLNFDHNQPFSISAWILTSASSGPRVIVSNLDPANNFRGYELLLNGDSSFLNFQLISGAGNQILVSTVASLTASYLYHVVMTYDGSSTAAGVKFYVNGSVSTPTTDVDTLTGITTNSIIPSVGARTDHSVFFLGNIGPVYIYNRVLTSTDVTDLYTVPYTPLVP